MTREEILEKLKEVARREKEEARRRIELEESDGEVILDDSLDFVEERFRLTRMLAELDQKHEEARTSR